MDAETKDMLIQILANQAVIYKKVSIIENRSKTIFSMPNMPAYFEEMNKEAELVVPYIKQLLGA